MVEVFHPCEFRFIGNFTRTTLASGHVSLSGTTVCGQDDDILCIQLSRSSSGGDRVRGNTQFPRSLRSHGTPGPKSPARRPTHRSIPTRSQAGDLVGKYGGDQVRRNTQFPCSRRSHGTPGSKSPPEDRPTVPPPTRRFYLGVICTIQPPSV